MNKENLCNSCKHEKMCKFKKDFIIAEKEFNENETEVNKKLKEDDLIEVKVNCKFYLTEKTIDIIPSTPSPFTPPYTFLKRGESCENCD